MALSLSLCGTWVSPLSGSALLSPSLDFLGLTSRDKELEHPVLKSRDHPPDPVASLLCLGPDKRMPGGDPGSCALGRGSQASASVAAAVLALGRGRGILLRRHLGPLSSHFVGVYSQSRLPQKQTNK